MVEMALPGCSAADVNDILANRLMAMDDCDNSAEAELLQLDEAYQLLEALSTCMHVCIT